MTDNRTTERVDHPPRVREAIDELMREKDATDSRTTELGSCDVVKLDGVEVQQNGIIRDNRGWIIGRADTEWMRYQWRMTVSGVCPCCGREVDANDVSTRKGDVRADDVCANDANVSQDSREKLEADVIRATKRTGTANQEDVWRWLDRQAAITERETKLRELYKFEENHRGHIRSIEEVNQKLNKRIAELTAERDALADDLLTCNKEREEYRELFSKSLTLAAEIVNLQP